VLELKKLMPCRRRVNAEHVVSVHGTGLIATERAALTDKINEESLKALKWERNQVKQKMMFATARVGLKVGVRKAKIFSDIRDSLREDTSDANIARICEICYGDYEGEEAKRWSSSLEDKCMREMRLEHRCEPAKELAGQGRD
jgi:hypothetical protein